MKVNTKILEEALNDEHREKNGLNVIFVTEEKHPGLKNWQNHAKGEQSEDQIKKLWNKKSRKNVGYSYFTGVGGLIDVDFDWEWPYHLALREFGDRMETRTIKTPNGGYRSLFIVDDPEDFLDFKSKHPHVEIHGKDTHHVIVHGKVKDDQGNLKEYEVVKDTEIKKDSKILHDMKGFLKKINDKCKFLAYKCIASKLKHKKNYLTQEQRTSIGAFFAAENIDLEIAKDFFRTCEDFDEEVTRDHLQKLYEKGFKYPTCETLKDNFSWDECKGCSRLSEGRFIETSDPVEAPEIDIRELSEKDLFQGTEIDGQYISVENVSAPIFEVKGEIYYAIALKSQATSNGPQNTIGIYGSKSGYALDPLAFNINDDSAMPDVNIHNIRPIMNDDQHSTIERSIQKAVKSSRSVKESPESILTETPLKDVGALPADICEKLRYYVSLKNPIEYMIITCWILGTYLFPLFATYGYLIVNGEKGTGKGTVLDLLNKMCWNATQKTITPSEPALFRLITQQLPTMLIDEYHRIVENTKLASAMISIIESGYEKGGVVLRAEQIKGIDGTVNYEVSDYSVYGPKALVSRKDVEADDKGIKIIIPKIYNDDTYAKRKKELLSDTFMDNIRERIMMWVISNQNQVMLEHDAIEPNKDLNGREFNVWLPILSISKLAFPEKYQEIIDFAGQAISKNRRDFSEKESRVLKALFSLYPDNLNDGVKKLKEPSYLVTNKEINEALTDIEGEGIHPNTVKSALNNLNLNGHSDQGKYYIKKHKLEEMFHERGFETTPLTSLTVKDSQYFQIYQILLEHEDLDEKSLTKLLSESSNKEESAHEIVKYLLRNGYMDSNPEGHLEPSDKLRETLEKLSETKCELEADKGKGVIKM